MTENIEPDDTPEKPRRLGLFDHPRGLIYLCAPEGFERFSYFGMQSLLVLYLNHHLLLPEHFSQVVGLGTLRSLIESVTGPLTTTALASQMFGLYSGLVYGTPLLGGLLADRWLGRTPAVIAGATLMAAGHFLMAFESSFLLAIALLLVGVGCFKGNIASQVGGLYIGGDPRRASAYQLFQLAISFAVIAAPLICGTLGEKVGWHYGFVAAGVGMLAGLTIYVYGRKWLPPETQTATAGEDRPAKLSSREWKTILLLVALLPLIAASQVGNQQMFNVFVVWAEASFDLRLAWFNMPVTWMLSADAVISTVCLAGAILFWQLYRQTRQEPDDIVKIGIGAAVMAVAPLLLVLASLRHAATAALISPGWGLSFEIINEIGFALVAPVCLALYSSAAPKRIQGLMIGVYYLAIFMCNVTVGRLGGLLDRMNPAGFWLLHAAIVGGAAVLLAAVALWGRKLLAPVE